MAAPYQAANLDDVVQGRMMRFGVAMLLVALGLSTILLQIGASGLPRAFLFVPFWLAAYGVLSSLFRTCAFAALGAMRLGCRGAEPIAGAEGVRAVRRRGLRVLLASVALAALMTALLLGSPGALPATPPAPRRRRGRAVRSLLARRRPASRRPVASRSPPGFARRPPQRATPAFLATAALPFASRRRRRAPFPPVRKPRGARP